MSSTTSPCLRALAAGATVAVVAPRLAAQVAPPPAVAGTVRDSLAGGVLADATVQLVPADTPSAPGFVARTDSAGRYTLPAVPPGRYLLGFFHPRADLLGVALPARLVVVPADARPGAVTRADLALPGARTLAAAVCGAAPRDSTGVLAGRVLRAADGAPVAGAVVTVRWGEVVVDRAGVRRELRRVRAVANGEGRYAACGVPADVPVLAQARAAADTAGAPSPGEASGMVEVALDVAAPFKLRDLLTAPTAPTAGASVGGARLAGRVVRPDGRPVEGARVVVGTPAGADTAVTGQDGRYRLGGLAGGTRPVEVLAIGYAPQRAAADLRPGAEATLNVRLAQRVTTLDRVSVYAAAPDLASAFARRRRQGFGQFLTAADLARRNPMWLTDALATVPGVRAGGMTPAGRPVLVGRFGCTPTYFLDGMRLTPDPGAPGPPGAGAGAGAGPPGARDATEVGSLARRSPPVSVDDWVRPGDVGGVEVYRNVWEAPAQFRGDGCSVVLIWTRGAVP